MHEYIRRNSELMERVAHQLEVLTRRIEELKMKVTDLQKLVSDLDTETNAVAARIDEQTKAIADLQSQIASGTPVTQEQLDAVVNGLTPISDRLKSLGADPAQPIPPAV